MIDRLISGGQTGVDRAALDAAMDLGIAHGGWCPAGRWAEDGPIPDFYTLHETPEGDPAQRTAWNVRDSDATLILLEGHPSEGTALTLAEALRQRRSVRLIDLDGPRLPSEVRDWIKRRGIRVLNVAGPRESQRPGINRLARAFLLNLLMNDR